MIGPKTLSVMSEMITGLLNGHTNEINQAYLNAEGKFSISLGIGVSEAKEGVKLETSMSFVSDRVKDKSIRVVDERQMELDEQR